MLKPHCDRCDALIEESVKSWIELVKPGTSREMVVHISLNGGQREDTMFCKDCVVIILVTYLKEAGISATIRSDIFSILYPPEQTKIVAPPPLAPEKIKIEVPPTLPDSSRALSVDENTGTDDEINF